MSNSQNDFRAHLSRITVTACAILVMFLALPFCGCRSGDPEPVAEAPESHEIVKETTRGPVTLELRIDRGELSIADRLSLSLTVDADEDYDVVLPKVGEKLEQFGIVDYSTSLPRLVDNGKVRSVRTYVLEPFLSGEYTIPPMNVVFRKKNDPADTDHQVETEAVTVVVTSLLPEDVAELDVEDIEGPLEPPPPSFAWLWFTLAGGVAAIVLVWVIVRLVRRRQGHVAPELRIPAHEIAYEEFRLLIAEDLVDRGLTKEFYQRVSGILRRYIENRFALHAPEWTTEEFLAELGVNDILDPEHKRLLQTFLTHCDLVKFAEFAPTTKQIQETFDSSKTFIEQTREDAT